MKGTNKDTQFEYTTLNEIVEDGMKAEKREYLYKILWIEKELTMFLDGQCFKSMIAVRLQINCNER